MAKKHVWVLLLVLTTGCSAYFENLKARESFVEGAQLLNKAEYQAALAKFTEAADKFRQLDDPQHEADALVFAATACSMMKQWPESLRMYERAIKANQRLPDDVRAPRHATILLAVAGVHSSSGDIGRATTYAQQVLHLAEGLEPKVATSVSASAHSVLGSTSIKAGKYAEAIEHLQLALSGIKGQVFSEAMVLTNLGLAYNNMGDYTEAVSFHDQAIQKTHGGKSLLAQFWAATSMYPGTYEGGLQGLNATLFLNRGVSKRNMGDHVDAIKDFELALDLLKEQPNHPTRGIVLFNLGLTYLEKGDSQKGVDYISHTTDHLSLGRLALITEDWERAVREFEEGLKEARDLGNVETLFAAHVGLGLACESSGQTGAANESFRRAVQIADAIYEAAPEKHKPNIRRAKIRGFSRNTAYHGLSRTSPHSP